MEQGIDVILEIDVQGAMQVRQSYPSGIFIFILPPSIEELRKRIEARGSETRETMARRLGMAMEEISSIGRYDYRVINDDLKSAIGKVRAIITAEPVSYTHLDVYKRQPIGRDSVNRLRNAVTDVNSKEAVTHYRVLERFGRFTLIEARLETGRTHQIRVHMSYIRHPLLGDSLYGPSGSKAAGKLGAKRQMLHAGVLGFIHPVTGQYMEFESPLPEDFAAVLKKLRNLV